MDVRLKFRKFGCMKYVGHLDMMRFFQKVLRRAELPIAYSAGFSPHMIMSFAAPLGIGLTSDAEYLDVQLIRDFDGHFDETTWVSLLNTFMPEGLEVIRAVILPENSKGGMASVSAADYEIRFIHSQAATKSKLDSLGFFKWDDFIKQKEIFVLKKTKKNEREIDIKDMIYESVHITDGDERIFLRVAHGSSANLKPELVMEAYDNYIHRDYDFASYHIHRIEVYETDDATGNIVPLIPYIKQTN